ncbi:MAG: class I SAM-dependent methyltransferase [Nocardioides sp.]
MSFEVAAEAYGRFMGRWSTPLAGPFARWSDVRPGQRALDVGCGPGVLTHELVALLGTESVAAVDPSPTLVSAAMAALPGVDVRQSPAESLPFDDDSVDRSLAQLVVNFMADPVAGLGEMRRVTRPDGLVTACLWDHAGGRGPLSTFWSAVAATSGEDHGEMGLPGVGAGELADLFATAGLRDVEEGTVSVTRHYTGFEDWWEPYTLGVGPAGAYVARLDAAGVEELREACRTLLPDGAFDAEASACCVRGRP